MKPIRTVAHWCGKGLKVYWHWMVKTGEDMGDMYGPW